MPEDLLPSEIVLVGQWVSVADNVEGDATCTRIRWLTNERLERLGSDKTGWDTLFEDPRDGRLWELTYPQSEMQGGGPPRLSVITRRDAAVKYHLNTD